MKIKHIAIAVFVSVAAVASLGANAALVTYDLSGGGVTGSFQYDYSNNHVGSFDIDYNILGDSGELTDSNSLAELSEAGLVLFGTPSTDSLSVFFSLTPFSVPETAKVQLNNDPQVSVTITPLVPAVPLPSTLWLLLGGLVMFGVSQQRRVLPDSVSASTLSAR
jgi:hypothetical protein